VKNSSQLHLIRLGYVIIAGMLGLASWWVNGFVFQHIEVSSGINLVYWPHGVRVLVVLLFGFSGAIGLTVSAFWVAPVVYSDEPTLSVLTPLVGGMAPYVARRIVLVETTHASAYLGHLRPETLISIVTLSALFNASGHILLRFSVNYGGNYPAEFCAMLAGDILGALSLLYAIKLSLVAFERLRGIIR
jgi:hypothetical protein